MLRNEIIKLKQQCDGIKSVAMDAMKAFEGDVNQADTSPSPSLSIPSPSSSKVWGTTTAATTASTGSPYILQLSHQGSGIRGGVGSSSNSGNNSVVYNDDDGYTSNNHIDHHISKSLRWTPIIGVKEDNIDSDLQQNKMESSSVPPPVVQLLYPPLNYSKHNHSITATTAAGIIATTTLSDMTATIEDAIEVVRSAIIIPIVEERFIMELYNKYALIMTTTTNNKYNKHKSSSSSTTTSSSSPLRCINSFRYFRFLHDFFITSELYSIKNNKLLSSSYDSNGGNISSSHKYKSNYKTISYGEVNIIYQEALRYNNNNINDDKNSRGNNLYHHLHAYTLNNNLQHQKSYQSNKKSTNNHHHMNNHNNFSSSSFTTDESKSSSIVGLNQIQFTVSLQAIALKLYSDVIIDEYQTPVEYLVGEMKKIAQRRAYELLLHERLIPIAVEYQGKMLLMMMMMMMAVIILEMMLTSLCDRHDWLPR